LLARARAAVVDDVRAGALHVHGTKLSEVIGEPNQSGDFGQPAPVAPRAQHDLEPRGASVEQRLGGGKRRAAVRSGEQVAARAGQGPVDVGIEHRNHGRSLGPGPVAQQRHGLSPPADPFP